MELTGRVWAGSGSPRLLTPYPLLRGSFDPIKTGAGSPKLWWKQNARTHGVLAVDLISTPAYGPTDNGMEGQSRQSARVETLHPAVVPADASASMHCQRLPVDGIAAWATADTSSPSATPPTHPAKVSVETSGWVTASAASATVGAHSLHRRLPHPGLYFLQWRSSLRFRSRRPGAGTRNHPPQPLLRQQRQPHRPTASLGFLGASPSFPGAFPVALPTWFTWHPCRAHQCTPLLQQPQGRPSNQG